MPATYIQSGNTLKGEKVAQVTKLDLETFERNIKSHIDLTVKPIVEKQDGHGLTLYGKEGRNGLVGDVRDIKTAGKFFKWLSIGGGSSGIGAMLIQFFSKSN